MDSPVAHRILRDLPNYNDSSVSDLERVHMLRRWASEMQRHGCRGVDRDSGGATLAQMIERFENDDLAVWCGGAAAFLKLIYNEFYFEAGVVDYGFAPLTHCVTLVKVDVAGAPRIVIQDSYFNSWLSNTEGEPLGYTDVLRLVGESRAHEINVCEEPVLRYRIQVPTSEEPLQYNKRFEGSLPPDLTSIHAATSVLAFSKLCGPVEMKR